MNEFKSPNQRYTEPQPWQTPGSEWSNLPAQTAAQATLSERLGFIRKVYALFFASILFGVGGARLGLNSPPVLQFASEHPWIMFFMMIGGVFGAQAVRHVPGVNLAALFGFTTLTGVMISPLLNLLGQTNPASIWQAGVLTVGIFGGLTAYVFISKKDFSFLRGLMVTGLIVVILAGLLNILIVGSSAFAFAISAATL
ncbi:MAG TPA: Bax inhibitor-1 family protein, partial [Pyrinomonadaceae bacterium]|nr:Bax inhibitor-1 family protein [Pyrinomonadaceae bacterium]